MFKEFDIYHEPRFFIFKMSFDLRRRIAIFLAFGQVIQELSSHVISYLQQFYYSKDLVVN